MWETKNTSKEVGYVVSATDYLLHIEGLPSARINDMLVNHDGARAIVTSLGAENIQALMLDHVHPKPGERFELSPNGLQLTISPGIFGRAFNPLGTALDGGKDLPKGGRTIDLDVIAPGIDFRKIIDTQFYTGMIVIDTLLPVGRGQRELVFGPPGSGKSSFLLTMIANQKGKNVTCIYVALGKSEVDVKNFMKHLKEAQADSYTIVLAASSSEPAPLISVAPSVAFTLAESFQSAGGNVLLILDDLGTHAKYLREIGLLSLQIPGRESYPSDLFYQYSRNIERAGNFTEDTGGGSITLLPIIETDMENMTGFVPTTLMSITDGHLLFTAALRAQGIFPAIAPDRSVTRVGHQTQLQIHRNIAEKIRSLLVNYHELERFSSFGSELSVASQQMIKRGSTAAELLKQEPLQYIDPMAQVLILSLVFTPFFDQRDIEFVKTHKKHLIEVLSTHEGFAALRDPKTVTGMDELIAALTEKLPILEASVSLPATPKPNAPANPAQTQKQEPAAPAQSAS